MKITVDHRLKVISFLRKFYTQYPDEKYTIFKFVSWFKERVTSYDRDIWMGVSGDTGGGKSLFMIMSLILFGKRTCDLKKNIAYNPEGGEIGDKFDALNRNILIVDEAAREMRAVNWQSKPQQKINTKAMTDRFKNNWVMFAMPNFKEFTKSMRTGNMQFRAIVLYRTNRYARILIQRKSRNWRSDDPWNDKKAAELYDRKIKSKKGELTNEAVLELERSLPNTIMDFIIPDLELIVPELVNEYKALKIASRHIEENEDAPINKREQRYENMFNELLNRVSKLVINDELELKNRSKPVSRAELANMLKLSASKVNSSFNESRLDDVEVPEFRKS